MSAVKVNYEDFWWSENDPTESIRKEWLVSYEEWLEDGVCHEIRGDYDYTENRIEIDLDEEKSTWEDFMRDYADQWEPTYMSRCGKHWKTYGELFYEEQFNDAFGALIDWIKSKIGDEKFERNEDAIREDVTQELCECDFSEPPDGWEEIHDNWLASLEE